MRMQAPASGTADLQAPRTSVRAADHCDERRPTDRQGVGRGKVSKVAQAIAQAVAGQYRVAPAQAINQGVKV